MRLSSIAFLFGLAWLGAEILTYALFIDEFGFAWALLVGLGSTILGALALRRLGFLLLATLRRRLEDGVITSGPDRAATFAALGGILLIMPGFLSNALGAALLAMGARALLMRPESSTLHPGGPSGTVELDPADWRRVDEQAPDARER